MSRKLRKARREARDLRRYADVLMIHGNAEEVRARNCAARYQSALNRLRNLRAHLRELEDAHRLVKKASASKDVTIGRLTLILEDVAPAIAEIRDLYAKDGTDADLLRSAAHEIRNRRAAAGPVTCCRLPLGHAGPCSFFTP